MRRTASWLGALAAALILPGCATVGPEYQPSDPDLPAAWHAAVPALFQESSAEAPWWRQFGDPVLEELIARGLEQNLDVKLALSRLREARAVARGTVAETGPSLDLSGEAGVEARRERGNEDAEDDETDTSGTARGALDGSVEIDLFGRLTRIREAAWAEAARQQALGHEARRLSVAEIARTYVELRAAERRLDLTERSLELQKRTLSLVSSRVDSGLAPALDRVRARAEVASLRAELGPLRAQISRLRNALAVLLGEPPGTMNGLLGEDVGEIPASESGRAVGVPTDLVRRRPDIRAAELQIAVSTAEVGVAVADLYPRLTLPGTISVGWTGIGEGSVVTSVLGSLSALFQVPLYDGGQREADVTAAEERLIQAGLTYRSTLLQALQQVESALAGYQGSWQRLQALTEAVESNRRAYEQSRELYRQGFVTFLDVLDSQRNWNDSLQALANARRDVSLEVINLYTALGAASNAPGRDEA